MAQAEGPCARAKPCANESASALMMKLMSPCACRVTFFERWRATTGNPNRSNSVAQRLRVGSGILDELEAVGSHRILKKLGHGRSPRRAISYNCNYYTPVARLQRTRVPCQSRLPAA
jgi:hypothetical protein